MRMRKKTKQEGRVLELRLKSGEYGSPSSSRSPAASTSPFVSSDYNNRSRFANGPRLSGHSRLRFRYISDRWLRGRSAEVDIAVHAARGAAADRASEKDIFGRVAAGDVPDIGWDDDFRK
uniref:Uncharacterized protein n=1 Tax=Ananas comosus var. bracteatus TaxID=296719 RepID=A0A6V7NLG8_ANACO|nr:unnamed protein product [Ananas comosus var. bracteatus]